MLGRTKAAALEKATVAAQRASELKDRAKAELGPKVADARQKVTANLAAARQALRTLPPSEAQPVPPSGFSLQEEAALLRDAIAAHEEPPTAVGFDIVADESAHNLRCVGRSGGDGVVTLSFRGSVIRGAGGELDVSNWSRVNLRAWPQPLAQALGGPAQLSARVRQLNLNAEAPGPARSPCAADRSFVDTPWNCTRMMTFLHTVSCVIYL